MQNRDERKDSTLKTNLSQQHIRYSPMHKNTQVQNWLNCWQLAELVQLSVIQSYSTSVSNTSQFFVKPSVAPHSGDWLLALPIANCGLRLEDEAVRVAVGMRLGLTLCVPHKCHCGSDVDAQGRHAMVCKKAPGRVARHQVLNNIIYRAEPVTIW